MLLKVFQPASDSVSAVQPDAPFDRPRATHARLLAILGLGLLLRLALAALLHGQPLQVWDERDYDQLAINLVRHGEFGFEPGTPISIRPPLYPALVAGIYRFAGEQNHTAVRVLQAGLAVATGWIVFLLGRNLYDERTGLIAAAVATFYPSLVAGAGLLLTETLFTFWICLVCYWMQRYLAAPRAATLIALGATLALGALTRSVLWLFPPVLAMFVLALSREPRWTMRLAHAALAVAAFVAVIAPWAVRNTRLQKTFTAVDVMGGRNFMMGNYEHTLMERPWDTIQIEGERSWHAVLRRRFPDRGSLTQGQIDKLAMRYAIEYILAHPGQSLSRGVTKFFHFWQLEREIVAGLHQGFWVRLPKPTVLAVAGVILAAYTGVLLAGLFGAALFPPAESRMHAFLLLLIAFVCGIHTLAFAHSRYRLPLMPVIGLYAAAAVAHPSAWRGAWRRPGFWLAALASAVLVTYWGWEILAELGRF